MDYNKEIISEEMLRDIPWACHFIQDLMSSTKEAALRWLKLAVEIDPTEQGNFEHVKTFKRAVKEVHEDLVLDMASLKEKYLDKIGKHLEKLEYLDVQLNCSVSTIENLDKPLKDLEIELKARHDRYEKIWLEEKAKLDLINKKHAELAKKLGTTPKRLSQGHSRRSIAHFEEKTEQMKSDFDKLVTEFSAIAEETKLMSEEIGYVLNEESLELTDCKDISRRKLQNLKNLYLEICKQAEDLRKKNENLGSWINRCWDYLHYPCNQRELFLSMINELNLKQRLNKLQTEREKILKEDLEAIIIEQKNQLNKIWDICFCGPNVKQDFLLMHTTEYNEDVFESFEKEIKRWENYYNENINILQTLKSYNLLKNEILELHLNTDTENLYQNRGGLLLQITRQHNILSHRMNQREQKLHKLAKDYLEKNGFHFTAYGESIENYIEKQRAVIPLGGSFKLSPRRKNTSSSNKFGSSRTPTSSTSHQKRKLKTSPGQKSATPSLPRFKLNQSRVPTPPKWQPLKLRKTVKRDSDSESWTDYSDFEKQLPKTSRSSSLLSQKKQ